MHSSPFEVFTCEIDGAPRHYVRKAGWHPSSLKYGNDKDIAGFKSKYAARACAMRLNAAKVVRCLPVEISLVSAFYGESRTPISTLAKDTEHKVICDGFCLPGLRIKGITGSFWHTYFTKGENRAEAWGKSTLTDLTMSGLINNDRETVTLKLTREVAAKLFAAARAGGFE